MAAFNKFNSFVGDLGVAKVNLNTDSFFFLLTNTSPNAADTVVDTTTTPCTIKSTSNASELAAGNGYVKKGLAFAGTAYSQTSGTGKWTANAATLTASGGSVGPFRYVAVFDDTTGTTSTRPVVGWWDYGSSITLANGESFKIAADTTGANWSSGTPLGTLS